MAYRARSYSRKGCFVFHSGAQQCALLLSLFVLCCSLLWARARAAEPPAQECVVVEKEGKVEVARKGSTSWTSAQTNEVLNTGDRLRTGSRSRAALRWSELSVARVAELTTLEIRPPARPTDKPQMELRSGATYFFSREKPTEIQFHTPVASGAIRGTEFNLAVAEDGRTELALLDGEVDMTNAQGTATLKSGELGTAEPGRAPAKTALVGAINVIQWVLYYPAVIDPDELGLTDAQKGTLKNSLEAYRQGALLQALNSLPENWRPSSDNEKVYESALLLAAGKVDEVQTNLNGLQSSSPLADALREVIVAVKHQKLGALPTPTTGSQWLARSYYLQSEGRLTEALNAAREATVKSPNFGAGWIRLAELEFGFGRTDAALSALNKGEALSPQNANGLALKGYVLAAQGKFSEAQTQFDRAIEVDGALSTAWLGRGMVKIRQGMDRRLIDFGTLPDGAGRADLQVAATLEPQRAVLRSYLGKAFSQAHDLSHARKELVRAKELDPNDPTSWLYEALLNQQANRINEAVTDLETSKELNGNRSIFRSQLLLDQDQAVREANLASIFRDAGMFDRSVQEASRAVENDYGNYSAHLFLANSYDTLRDPKLINLRYETPWFSELLVADLLAPPGGSMLSQTVSQQEYSKLFASDGLGLFSSTDYSSHGDWVERGSQYGTFGGSSYALDAYYRTERGYRPNNDLDQLDLALRFKQQITDKDSLFFQVGYFHQESGDVAQYYDQASASQTLRVTEKQEPNLLVGYHREWAPGSHTLFLFSRIDDTLNLNDSNPALLALITAVSPFTGQTNVFVQNPAFYSVNFQRELEAYSGELQQIWQNHSWTFIAGGRYQSATADTTDNLLRAPPFGLTTPVYQNNHTDLDRISVYGYAQWQILDSLRLIGGVGYDRLHFPVNIDTSPISSQEDTTDMFTPKAAIVWSPTENTTLRGIYSRSLGGAFFDTSVRLEPTQLAGFTDAFRSLIPESVAGLVPGTKFETFGAGLDQKFGTGTYVTVQGEYLKSDANRTVGILTNSDTTVPIPDSASGSPQSLDYKEKSLVVAFNQLLGKEWALGARYRLTDADMVSDFMQIPASMFGAAGLHQDVSALLQQLDLAVIYQHRCGFFAQFDAVWSQQDNHGYSPGLPGDDFWQYNALFGYRFLQRRVQAQVGVLNIGNRDYKLNPLTLYNELPRERTFVASLKLNF
jgi:tetratricopeptide (TPR) repeat protein